MGKKKNAQTSDGAAGSSTSARGKAKENLKTLNAKLVKDSEELREEIQHLRHQIAAATERLESNTAELKELESRLLAAVGEKNAVQMELNRILELRDFNQRKADSGKAWRKNNKWIFPAAITGIFLVSAAAAVVTFRYNRN